MRTAGPTWETWPLRRSPGRGVLGGVIVLASVVGAWWWSQSFALTGLALVVLVASTASFFFPTRYALSPDGVEIARPWGRRQRPWSDFRRVRVRGQWLTLTPFERDTWLEEFRGVTMPVPSEQPEVRGYVEEMVGPETRLAGS